MNKLFSHINENWPEHVCTIIIDLIITILGIAAAFFIFTKEINQNRISERDAFKHNIISVATECGINHGEIISLFSFINENRLPVKPPLLQNNIMKSLLGQPLTFKYLSEEYILALSMAITMVDHTNELISKTYNNIYLTYNKDKTVLEDVKLLYNKTMESLLIVLYLCQYYSYALDIKLGPTSGISDTVMNWLKGHNNPSILELENRIKELDTLPISAQQEIRSSYLKELSKWN